MTDLLDLSYSAAPYLFAVASIPVALMLVLTVRGRRVPYSRWRRIVSRLYLARERLTGRWLFCPDCGSCGIGGCCGYCCARCRDRHDGDTPDDGPVHDLGRVRARWNLFAPGWRVARRGR